MAQGFIEKYWPILGIPGTDADAKVVSGDTQLFYVNAAHASANDRNYGLDPTEPLATLQELIDRSTGTSTIVAPALQAGDTIFIDGDITETVVVPVTVPANCHLVGARPGIAAPVWTAATAPGIALTLQQDGWTVSGFRFTAGAAGTAIRLQLNAATGVGANRTVIKDNYFDGAWVGLYGVELVGAPFDVRIVGNEFREYRRGDSSAFALVTTNSAYANAYMCVVESNLFWENENHVGSTGDNKGFNLTLFKNNTFHEGVLIAATRMLDLRGGSQGKNIVVNNNFCGDYSNTGGYYANAGAPGNWVGNFAEDVAEAEVADNGVTIAVPAA